MKKYFTDQTRTKTEPGLNQGESWTKSEIN